MKGVYTALVLELPVDEKGAVAADAQVYTLYEKNIDKYDGDVQKYIADGGAAELVAAEYRRVFKQEMKLQKKAEGTYTLKMLQQNITKFLRDLGMRGFVRIVTSNEALYFKTHGGRSSTPLRATFACDFAMRIPMTVDTEFATRTLRLPQFTHIITIPAGEAYRETTFMTKGHGLVSVKHLGELRNPELDFTLKTMLDADAKRTQYTERELTMRVSLSENIYLFQTDFNDLDQIAVMANMMRSMQSVTLVFTDGNGHEYGTEGFKRQKAGVIMRLARTAAQFTEKIEPLSY